MKNFRRLSAAILSLVLTGSIVLSDSSQVEAENDPFKSQQIAQGLLGAKYKGYFADKVGYFAKAKRVSGPSRFSRVFFSTSREDYFSWQWTGYFRANQSGTWTFSKSSDDASYIWIGEKAVKGYSPDNA